MREADEMANRTRNMEIHRRRQRQRQRQHETSYERDSSVSSISLCDTHVLDQAAVIAGDTSLVRALATHVE